MNKIENECKKIRNLFWDFYVLNELWFRLGDGTESYGYAVSSISSHRLRKTINNAFENTCELFLKEIKIALEKSIRSEMKYIFVSPKFTHKDRLDAIEDINGLSALAAFCKQQGFSNRQHASKAPIAQARTGFMWDGWSEAYCGKVWADACDTYLELSQVITLKQKIAWIDKTLDLYHNEDFLLNKTAFAVLNVWHTDIRNDLDRRFELKNIKDLIASLDEERKYIVDIDSHEHTGYVEFTQRITPISSLTKNLLLAHVNKL